MGNLFERIIPPSRYFIKNRIQEVEEFVIRQQKSGGVAHPISANEITKEEQMILHRWIQKRTPRSIPRIIAVHLVEHCNLNCKGCCHYSCIAKPSYTDLELFSKDMERLAFLYDGCLREIQLMGGEPLLHPQAAEFGVVARKWFPSTQIIFVTNGILLLEKDNDFFEKCRQYNVLIKPTKYPIGFDYDTAEKRANAHGCKYQYFAGGKVEKTLWKEVLRLDGTCDTEESFTDCHRANACTCLREGKIYPCPIAAYAFHLNEYFGQVVKISERDSIDIYKANSADEINSFLSHSIPFCRYCDIKARTVGNQWSISEKRIEEWT